MGRKMHEKLSGKDVKPLYFIIAVIYLLKLKKKFMSSFE